MNRNSLSTRSIVFTVLFAVMALLSACSNEGATTSATTLAPLDRPFAVGHMSETLVDSSRPTPAGDGRPEKADRTIETSIYYPASGDPDGGVIEGAAPAEAGEPFPLVILAHGLGGYEEYLTPLAEEWVAAGYVVALPHFPLTYAGTQGGVDGADVQNQPGDVSFVIDEVLAASEDTDGALGGLVDPSMIGLAGHSNGGITVLGAVANSCCRDKRISTAIVLSGTPSPYADGTYDFTDVPPTMFVHGVNDQLVSYNQTVETFNEAATPKALLTLEEANHGDWLAPTNEAFPIAAQATIDFLDGYLRGDPSAVDRLADDQSPPIATMHFAPDDTSTMTVQTTPTPDTDRKASVTDDTDLRDGQVVTVSWSGFLPGKTVNVVQCTGDGRGGTATCGIADGHVLIPDPSGAGSVELTIRAGGFANGTCDATSPCTILVNDSGLLEEDAFIYFPITFA